MGETGLDSITELLLEERWLRALAAGLVHGPDRADEVVQETWLAAVTHPPERRGSARAWLATVARNAARQLLRRERRTARREAAAATDDAVPDVAEAVARVELRHRLAQEVLALEEPFRTAIVLRFFEGRSPADIASTLGVPAPTVRTRIHRGLAKLRERLDARYPGGRRAWTLALLPFAPERVATPAAAAAAGATLIPGALIMSAKVKLTLAAALALLAGAAAWHVATDDPGAPPSSPAPVPVPAPTTLADEAAPAKTKEKPEAAKTRDGRPREVVAENSRITGFVRRPDGTPASGVLIRSGFRGGFRVEHHSTCTLSGEDGSFAIPSVRGAPYIVWLPRGQPGLVGFEVKTSREVRGGATDLVFVVPEAPRVTIAVVDAVSGAPVEVSGVQIWYVTEGRRRYASVDLRGKAASRFTVGLPPRDRVDADTSVTIKVWNAPDRGYEPAAVTIPTADLHGDLGERKVPLRRLPVEGFTIRVAARYEDGEPFTGEARVVVGRGGIAVFDTSVAVIDGEGRRKGMPLGADRLTAWIEGSRAELAPCPTGEGETGELEFVLARRWELIVNPGFEGKPRRLSIRMAAGGQSRGTHSIGSGAWPYKLHGTEAENRTLVFGDEEGEIASETVDLVPGRRAVVRPRIPGREAEAAIAPVREPRKSADLPTPDGPGVLVGRIVVEGGEVPPPFALTAARFAEAGDSSDLPGWFETETAADGTFRFDGLPPGRYGMWVRPPDLQVKYKRFEIPEGGAGQTLEIVYDVGGALVVVVKGADGQPLAGETVGITPWGSSVRTSGAGIYTAVTDAKGRALFDRIPPGSWEVAWAPSGEDRQVKRAKVESGETAEVAFDLATTGSLSGRALGPEGEALARAVVRLWGSDGERAQTRTDGLGRFFFEGVAAGEYGLAVQALGPRWFAAPAGRVEIRAGDDATIEIRLPDTKITGRITREDTGAPLGRDEVQISAWRRVDGEHLHGSTWITEDGRFEFPGLPRGAWSIQVIPRGLPLGWVEKEVEIPASGRLLNVDIALPPK